MNQINKPALIVIVAMLMPVVLLGVTMYPGSPKNNAPVVADKATTNFPRLALNQARNNARSRLAYLEKMTPEQWAEIQKAHPIPFTLEQAVTNTRKRIEQLDAMTPEQWDARPQLKPRGAER